MKGERRSVIHKRLLYYFNVNRTSLDHLLLGGNADVDKNVEWSEYSAGSKRAQLEWLCHKGLWHRQSERKKLMTSCCSCVVSRLKCSITLFASLPRLL